MNELLYNKDFTLTFPIKEGKFVTEFYGSPLEMLPLTHLQAQIFQIENQTGYELCILECPDSENYNLEKLFEQEDNVLYRIPPNTTIKARNFLPFLIKRPYKMVLIKKLETNRDPKVVFHIVPRLFHDGIVRPQDFVLGNKCFRNINGELALLSEDYLLAYLKKSFVFKN